MFEDSTFESTGRIQTASRTWMAATFLTNSAILTSMVMIPLLFPQALPRLAMNFVLAMPTTPVSTPKPIAPAPNAVVVTRTAPLGPFTAPRTIPAQIYMAERPEIAAPINATSMELGGGNVVGALPASTAEPHHAILLREEPKRAVRITGMVVEGMLLRKTVPIYPPIARAAHVEGTVVLAALIARDGTIQNLHVLGGNGMLQQAALDAVRTWRYRPYLLNGEPVEVETTVNVIFQLR